MKSMTGFARLEYDTGEYKGSIQLKSYNNRYLDISIYLPPYLSSLEPLARKFLEERMNHGKVELAIRVRECAVPAVVSIDEKAAIACARTLSAIATRTGISSEIKVSDIIGFEGVLTMDREIDIESAWASLGPELLKCFSDFDATRRAEGEATLADFRAKLATIRQSVDVIERMVPELERGYERQLRDKFNELLGSAIDENRILSEIAVYITKYTISEELVRLRAHLEAFEATISKDAACGKKLDFICQELNREVNTIGSKNALVIIGREVIDLKGAIEDIREQVRNIE
jgi:uncharacterized protein (TIGR00255 family)